MTRSRRVDQSGAPPNRLPPMPKVDLQLYHWSPTKNRANINKYGLLTHRSTIQGAWRPPYVCFGDDPVLSWSLSGNMWPSIAEWDLWVCNDSFQTSYDHYEVITDTFYSTGRHFIKEYRIYTRVFKRDLTYLGTRTQ